MAEYKGAGDTVTINDVLEVCGKYITNQESIDLINQAYDFIMEKHEGQKRKSGETVYDSPDLGSIYFGNVTNGIRYYCGRTFA